MSTDARNLDQLERAYVLLKAVKVAQTIIREQHEAVDRMTAELATLGTHLPVIDAPAIVRRQAE